MSNSKVDTIVEGFFEYLKKNNSLDLVPEIISGLKDKMDEGKTTAIVFSGISLSKIQNEAIIKILNSNFGIKNVEFKIDKNLLGGIKVSISDKVLDLSLQSKLDYINKSI